MWPWPSHNSVYQGSHCSTLRIGCLDLSASLYILHASRALLKYNTFCKSDLTNTLEIKTVENLAHVSYFANSTYNCTYNVVHNIFQNRRNSWQMLTSYLYRCEKPNLNISNSAAFLLLMVLLWTCINVFLY